MRKMLTDFLYSGTDATHAEHIETIKNRCYVGVQQDGTFLPGQLGMGLVEGKGPFTQAIFVTATRSNFCRAKVA